MTKRLALPDISDSIARMPKVDLHCHLEACFRHQTLRAIGARTGIDVPADQDTYQKEWLITQPAADLEAMIDKFDLARQLWCDPQAIYQLTREAVIDAAAQNVRLLELRYAPEFIQNGRSNLSYENIHQAVLEGITDARQECEIAVGLIGILVRSSANCADVADFIFSNADTFVGIDIADAELGYPCRDFQPFFERAHAVGLHTTAHAGEIDADESRQNIREAIEILKVDRIGHGVHAIDDPALIELLIDRETVLEVCPTSNILTRSFAAFDEHPLPALLRHGVKVTLNTDDPSLFGIDWNIEYEIARSVLGLSIDEIRQCNHTAIAASFLPENERPTL